MLDLVRHFEDVDDFADDLLALAHVVALDDVGHALVEVIVHDERVHLVERLLHGQRLLHDVDTVNIVLDHPLDAANVSFDNFQATHDLFALLGSIHMTSYPPRWGWGSLIIIRVAKASSPIYGAGELAYNEASNRAAFSQMSTTQTKENSWLRWQLTRGVQQLWSRLPWRRPSLLCPTCSLDLSHSEMYKRVGVCERCAHHFPIGARRRIELFADPKSFDEFDKKLSTQLKTVSIEETYPRKLKEAQRETHMQEAVVTGTAEVSGHAVVLIVLDFRFMGGSMGWAVGEKITRAFERAADERLPVIAFTATGGARIQEGMFSL